MSDLKKPLGLKPVKPVLELLDDLENVILGLEHHAENLAENGQTAYALRTLTIQMNWAKRMYLLWLQEVLEKNKTGQQG